MGERFDADAGLQYLNARYYDPQLGMFLQPDWREVMQPGVGTNRYSYSFGDPVNGIDPTGHDWNPTDGSEFNGEASFTSMSYRQQMTNVCSAGGCAIVGLGLGGPAMSLARTAVVALATRAPGALIAAADIGTTQATGMVAGATGVASVATSKVLGNPQITRGADGLIHAATSVKVAIAEIVKLGPSNIASVHFNRSLRTIFGIVDRRQPDVTIVTRDGCVILCEVVSRTQTVLNQTLKADQMQRAVSNATGLNTSTVIRNLDRSTSGNTGGFLSKLKSLLGIK
ncbi:MAG: RHS repeat-associated core domain-containing protein [Microgenomates group bacterium]